ncbi:MAG: alpha/beta fold hydrolase [Desulfosarcina sp.]|jgi:alpha-beta hydrolase superfamily lysophospholipase
MLKPPVQTIVKKGLFACLCAAIGGLVALVLAAVFLLESRPDLNRWHEVILDAEYTAESSVTDWKDYLALEDRLFQQLERLVLDRVPRAERGPIQRYHRGSLSDPGRWKRNWNRSFELANSQPTAGVLLLHGMSDSPYSLRVLGQRLNNAGAWVIGLRLPGHGTVPSGLIHPTWEDMAAAVRLAMRHLKDRVQGRPIFLVGYSTGGALAVNYALESLDDADVPAVKKIVLIAPAMGVTPLAALSVWQARLGRWLGLPKLAWNSISLEYNPYKYSSFAINAGDQVYRLSNTIQLRLDAALADGVLDRFPQTLTFQSLVDATVSTRAVFSGLYQRLTNPGNELVVFDINRQADIDELLTVDPLVRLRELAGKATQRFVFDLVTNEHPTSRRVVVHRSGGNLAAQSAEPLAWQWPEGVHSLSHVALPFSFEDPLYGASDAVSNPGLALSKITLRGERGVIKIPASAMLRIKWNPFYPYLEQRVLDFLQLAVQ